MKETDSNKEFIPYEQAVALKELGFDEYCLRYFMMDILNPTNLTVNYDYFKEMIEINKNLLKYTHVLAPLYQQAFNWFRVKYDLRAWVQWGSEYLCLGQIQYGSGHIECISASSTNEEAELACLKKLIEIVTKKQWKN